MDIAQHILDLFEMSLLSLLFLLRGHGKSEDGCGKLILFQSSLNLRC